MLPVYCDFRGDPSIKDHPMVPLGNTKPEALSGAIDDQPILFAKTVYAKKYE